MVSSDAGLGNRQIWNLRTKLKGCNQYQLEQVIHDCMEIMASRHGLAYETKCQDCALWKSRPQQAVVVIRSY